MDYAHTPDALDNVLRALRPLVVGRLIVVFGAGGDRDQGKRAAMGAAASRHADLVIVTSDNPRTEDPDAIIAQILPGLDRRVRHIVEPNRYGAIHEAIRLAGPDDVVVIAGKGHEAYQVVGTERRPFDDVAVVREAFEEVVA